MGWKKEVIDQPLHALWSGVSVFVILLGWQLGAPLWISVPLTVAGSASLAGLCYREWAQKKHKAGGIFYHWPWLDTIGYGTGVLIGAALVVWL